VLELLRGQGPRLYALLDAARDERIVELLELSELRHESLYDGEQADVVADWGPWLVELPPDAALLEELVAEGWGESWGVYLTSSRRFNAVRRHFRQFLVVRTEQEKPLLFRFYDPRVLRVFLPICTARQTSLLFSDVQSFLLADEEPATLLRFTAGQTPVKEELAVRW